MEPIIHHIQITVRDRGAMVRAVRGPAPSRAYPGTRLAAAGSTVETAARGTPMRRCAVQKRKRKKPQDMSSRVREQAATALGHASWNTPGRAEALEFASQDPDPGVRHAVKEANELISSYDEHGVERPH